MLLSCFGLRCFLLQAWRLKVFWCNRCRRCGVGVGVLSLDLLEFLHFSGFVLHLLSCVGCVGCFCFSNLLYFMFMIVCAPPLEPPCCAWLSGSPMQRRAHLLLCGTCLGAAVSAMAPRVGFCLPFGSLFLGSVWKGPKKEKRYCWINDMWADSLM